MKKFLLLLILPVLLAICSCTILTEAMSIEITTFPKTVYNLNEEIDDFVITVKYNDNTKKDLTFSKENSNNIVVTGFDTKTVGDKTCVIKYESLSVLFDYSVVNTSSFAGGTGTQDSPYLIENVDQLLLANDGPSKKYYKLLNNIDITDSYLTKDTYEAYLIDIFYGMLDGDNHKITLHSTKKDSTKEGELNDYQTYLVKKLSSSDDGFVAGFENLNVEIDGACTLVKTTEYSCSYSFKNLSIYGSCFGTELTNYSLFITESKGSSHIVFENCKNYANVIGHNPYMSIFVAMPGFSSNNEDSFRFVNCANYGIIEGDKVAMFFANTYRLKDNSVVTDEQLSKNITITNTVNYGELRSYDGYAEEGTTVMFAKEGYESYDKIASQDVINRGVIENLKMAQKDFSSYYKVQDGKLILMNNTDETLHMYVVASNSATVSGDGVSGSLNISTTKKYDVEARGEIEVEYSLNAKIFNRAGCWFTYEDGNFYFDAAALNIQTKDNVILESVSYRVYVYNTKGDIVAFFKVAK